jgi:hypothetical protein
MLASSILTFAGNAAWQVALIALGAVCVGQLLRRGAARFRYLTYSLALAASSLVPLVAVLLASQPGQGEPSPAPQLSSTPTTHAVRDGNRIVVLLTITWRDVTVTHFDSLCPDCGSQVGSAGGGGAYLLVASDDNGVIWKKHRIPADGSVEFQGISGVHVEQYDFSTSQYSTTLIANLKTQTGCFDSFLTSADGTSFGSFCDGANGQGVFEAVRDDGSSTAVAPMEPWPPVFGQTQHMTTWGSVVTGDNNGNDVAGAIVNNRIVYFELGLGTESMKDAGGFLVHERYCL